MDSAKNIQHSAFDKVCHQGLLYKIKKCFSDHYYWLFTSYLKNRYFQVKEEGDFSHIHAIRPGVRQGSIHGPFLYSRYTADIPTTEYTFVATYADDTAILTTSPDPGTASNKLQERLDTVGTISCPQQHH